MVANTDTNSQPDGIRQIPAKGDPLELTPRQNALITEALAIEQEEAREAGALGFMARTLAQVTLPHRDPKTVYYERTSGALSLLIRGHKAYGVPFGTVPRVVLAWICTEAVRTQDKTLILGRSVAEFAEKVGMSDGGRERSRLKTQCLALAKSLITIEAHGSASMPEAEAYENILIANRGFVFWSDKNHDQPSLWESTLTLTEDFFKAVVSRPVPIDLRVYHALSQSPLAMDIYTWLTYRMFVLRKSGKPFAMVPWVGLQAQFGSNFADTPQGRRDFKKSFRLRLNEVLQFYPEARSAIEEQSEHLLLKPCRLHLVHTGNAKLSKLPV